MMENIDSAREPVVPQVYSGASLDKMAATLARLVCPILHSAAQSQLIKLQSLLKRFCDKTYKKLMLIMLSTVRSILSGQ